MLHILNNIKKRGEVKHMKRKTFRKSLAVVLSIILAMSVIVQNVSLVYGEKNIIKELVTHRLGKPGDPELFTFVIEDLVELKNIETVKVPGKTSDNVIVNPQVNGNTVTGSVYGDNAEVISDGYKYTFKINYIENTAPVLNIKEPSTTIKRYDGLGYLKVEGSVTDPNKQDIKLYYLINKNQPEATQTTASNSPTPTASATPTPTPLTLQKEEGVNSPYIIKHTGGTYTFTAYIPLGELKIEDKPLDEGLYDVKIWANDGLKNSNEITLTFYNDKSNPSLPKFTVEPKDKYVKKGDNVKVSIIYPTSSQPNIPPKNIKIHYYCINEDNKYIHVDKLYTGSFDVKENMTVYAACYDEFNRKSSLQPFQIISFDTVTPAPPKKIDITSDKTVTDEPIKFIIEQGTDNNKLFDLSYYDDYINKSPKEIESVVTTKYSYDEGKTWNDYNVYEAEILPAQKVGTFKIWAKSVDKARNESEIIKSEEVTIKSSKPAPTSAPSSAPSGGGGSIIYVPPVQVESPSPSTTSEPVTTPPLELPSPTPIPIPADLGVFLTSDKTAYEENSTVTFSVYYNNKLTTPAENVVIKAEIPKDIIVVDAANGTVSGYTISWNIGTLDGKATGQIIFKLKIGKLSTSEVALSSKVTISSANQMTNTDDDESIFNFIGFSKNIAGELHTKFINGYENKQFRPDNMITRAEVAKILVTALSLEKTEGTENKFKDVDSKHWAYDYINIAVENGIFSGYGDGTFSPNKAITRAELSTALAKYLKLKNIDPAEVHFNDISNHWAKNYIEEIYRLKLIAGYSDGTFKPDAQIKRSECVTIICRLLNRGPLNNADAGFTDVSKTHWAYGYIAEGSLDHNYTRNSDGSETLVKK